MKGCLFSHWLRNAVFSMINMERMVEMLSEAWGRRSGPFFPPLPAPVWGMVGREGSACRQATWNLCRNPHHGRPRALGSWRDRPRATSGREDCCILSSATTEKQLPMAFPFPEPHEKFSGREGGSTHSTSGCENSGLSDRMLTMRRGQHRGLGAPGNLGEVQE